MGRGMGNCWVLTDHFEPVDGGDKNNRVAIFSGDEARTALKRLAELAPRIAVLEGPAGEVLQIGIGGPWAGLARIESDRLYGQERQRIRVALPRVVLAPVRVDFFRWAQPCTLTEDELFPSAEVVELVAGFISTGAFSGWVGWRTC